MKQDVRGRVRTPTKRREALLDEFERSGVSGGKFASLVGVKYQTFAAWVCTRRKNRALASKDRGAAVDLCAPSSLRLVEAVMATGEKRTEEAPARVVRALNVHLASGVRIEVGDATQLKLVVSLIKALGVERPC